MCEGLPGREGWLNFNLMCEKLPDLLKGVPLTIELVSISLFIGLFLALGIAMMRLSNNRVLNGFARGYVFYFRGSPLLVQVFLLYYGFGQFEFVQQSFLWPFLKEAYWCGILALTLNTGAYTAEIIRGGLQSVPFGQIESARAMGMSGLLLYRRIIFPIAFRQALPAYGNEMILMVKGTSLVSIITLMEITGIAKQIIAKYWTPVEIFLIAGLLYLILNFLVTQLVKYLEIKFTPYLRHPK
ncbi:MAG TPA: ABC transporter permease [Candidatus Thioglobus sp.]|nr:ABC transporter permease [Candidatus Thioglobus sp.]HIL21367.1 ABC transporter permease [Candidatus Thioglobus sp.]